MIRHGAEVCGLVTGRLAASAGEESHEGISVWHRGNVLLGLYGIWHGAPDRPGRTIDLGFLISSDGLHFREPETESVFFKRGTGNGTREVSYRGRAHKDP